MENKKEMTAPIVSAATDTEQPFPKCIDNNISDYDENIKSFEKMQRELLQSLDPSYLKIVSMKELYETVYQGKLPLIDSLLFTALISLQALQARQEFLNSIACLSYQHGPPLWDYPVRKGTVLYLALEDDYHRLQERLYRMFR